MDLETARTNLAQASRSELLQRLGGAIIEMTVLNRASYDEADALESLVIGNERIHRLAGHLRDLADPSEPFTDSRLNGVMEQLAQLSPRSLDQVMRALA